MGNGLDIPPPPDRKKSPPDLAVAPSSKATKETTKPKASAKPKKQPVKFDKQAETEKVQFNKRVTRRTADTFDMLAIKTRVKVPDLLDEAADYLESKYGKV